MSFQKPVAAPPRRKGLGDIVQSTSVVNDENQKPTPIHYMEEDDEDEEVITGSQDRVCYYWWIIRILGS